MFSIQPSSPCSARRVICLLMTLGQLNYAKLGFYGKVCPTRLVSFLATAEDRATWLLSLSISQFGS